MKDEHLQTVRTALTLAARTFESYAMGHRLKDRGDSLEKAEANDALAAKMREALDLCQPENS